MQNSLAPPMQNKIRSLDEIEEILEKVKKKGLRIIQCHGVFDLLHPGHIRHFKMAKAQGDLLVVSVTPDRFVNKGPGRPVFTESLRIESIAALQEVDYIVLNDTPDAVSAIQKIRPNFYVKGIEYKDHQLDVTGKISEESQEVEKWGGQIFYTDEIVFSSSSLLNTYFDSTAPELKSFIQNLKSEFSLSEIIEKIESLKGIKVLIIGDAIIDEYQYAEPLGQSGKGHHMVAKCLDKEIFLGGSLIIANHIAQFSDNVTLLTAVGAECPYASFIRTSLDPKIRQELIPLQETSTLIKKRYVLKDGKTLSKLFETYSGQEKGLESLQTLQCIQYLKEKGATFDLILVADFGNGFTNPMLIDAICDVPSFFALNTQMNSGNRGYNTVSNYRRADYISLNEPELRMAAHDKHSAVEGLAFDICEIMNAQEICVTQGVRGVSCYSRKQESFSIPALASYSIDRIGAGDAFLSLSSLCMAKKIPFKLAAFMGTLAASMSVQMVGNQDPIKKAPFIKYLTRLLK